MRFALALPLLALLLVPATLSLAPTAEAVYCDPGSQGPGLVGATLYFVGITVADNCNNALWYSCYVLTVLVGPAACLA